MSMELPKSKGESLNYYFFLTIGDPDIKRELQFLRDSTGEIAVSALPNILINISEILLDKFPDLSKENLKWPKFVTDLSVRIVYTWLDSTQPEKRN